MLTSVCLHTYAGFKSHLPHGFWYSCCHGLRFEPSCDLHCLQTGQEEACLEVDSKGQALGAEQIDL